MHRILQSTLFVLFILIQVTLPAQLPLNLNWSEGFSMSRSDHAHKILTADSTGFYVLSLHNNYASPFNPGTPIIDHIDWNNHRVSTQVLAGFQKTDSINYKEVVNIKGFCYLIYNREISKNYYVFYAQPFDYKQNRLSGLPLAISDTVRSVKLEFFNPFYINLERNGFETLGFDYVVNTDKIAFIYYKTLHDFTLTVYNRKMKLLWTTKYSLPFDDRTTRIRSFNLTISGSIVVYLTQSDTPRKNQNRTYQEEDKNQHFALILHGNEDDDHLYNFNSDKAYINSMDVSEETNGTFRFIGFYSEQEYNRSYGIVQYILDPFTKKVTALDPQPFSSQLIKQIRPQDDKVSSRSIPSPAFLNYIPVIKELSMEFLETEGAVWSVEDAVVLRFDSTLQNITAVVAPKKQALDSREDYSEYASTRFFSKSSGNTYLFYNDHLAGKDAKIRVARIDKQHKFQSISTVPALDIPARILPGSIYFYNGKALVLAESPSYTKYYFGTMDVP